MAIGGVVRFSAEVMAAADSDQWLKVDMSTVLSGSTACTTGQTRFGSSQDRLWPVRTQVEFTFDVLLAVGLIERVSHFSAFEYARHMLSAEPMRELPMSAVPDQVRASMGGASTFLDRSSPIFVQ